MIKYGILFVSLLIGVGIVSADVTPDQDWYKVYNYGYANSVQQTLDGGYIFLGDNLVKTDDEGNEQWNKPYNGNSVKQTPDGGYIIVGDSNGNVNLVKTKSDGDKDWSTVFARTNVVIDTAKSVQPTSDGGYVIAGSKGNQECGRGCVWLIKTDGSGKEQWNKIWSSEGIWGPNHGWDGANYVRQTSDGGYIIAGFNYNYGAPMCQPGPYALVIKTDINGKEEWSNTYGEGFDCGNKNSTIENAIFADKTSNGYVIIGNEIKNYEDTSETNAFFMKTDSNGKELFKKTYKGTFDSVFSGITSAYKTSDGGYILSGSTNNDNSGNNAWLIRVNSNGDELWNTILPEKGEVRSGQQTSDGGYILGGITNYDAAGGRYATLIKIFPESEKDGAISSIPSAEPKVKVTAESMIEYSIAEIDKLLENVKELNIDKKTKKSLITKLSNANSELNEAINNIGIKNEDVAENLVDAKNMVGAFSNKVKAQSDKKIKKADADLLIEKADKILLDIEATKNNI